MYTKKDKCVHRSALDEPCIYRTINPHGLDYITAVCGSYHSHRTLPANIPPNPFRKPDRAAPPHLLLFSMSVWNEPLVASVHANRSEKGAVASTRTCI